MRPEYSRLLYVTALVFAVLSNFYLWALFLAHVFIWFWVGTKLEIRRHIYALIKD